MLKNDMKKRMEHEAIRNSVGWYIFTHKIVEVAGSDSQEFIDMIYPNSIKKAQVNDAKYTTMLNEDGIVIDDVIIFRVEESKYWISTLYVEQLLAWFDKYKADYDINYKNITRVIDMYAIQGPNSRKLLNKILKNNIDDMKFFSIRDNKIDNEYVKVARMGYTGELGFEIMVDAKHRTLIEDKLNEYGKEFGAVHVLDLDVIIGSIPTEKGYILMSDIEGTNPYEVDLGYSIDWDKDFIGNEAVKKAVENVNRNLFGFEMEDNEAIIKTPIPILKDGVEVGVATRFTYGYTIEKAIGYALVDKFKAKIGDEVSIGGYKAKICERGWYDMNNTKPLGK